MDWFGGQATTQAAMLALIQAAANPTHQGNVTVSLSPTDVTTLKSLVTAQKAKVAENEKGVLSKLIADATPNETS